MMLFRNAYLVLSSAILLLAILFSFYHVERLYRLSSNRNRKLPEHDQGVVIPIVGAVGPESFAFDRQGEGPYTGVSDGRIIKWLRNESRWVDFATVTPRREVCQGSHDHTKTENICGRPLGLRFNQKTGYLYIADAYMGLLSVGPSGGLATQIAKEAEGFPFRFANSLDIDQSSGVVYFTDSSMIYQRRNYVSIIVSGDSTGRLIKFDPRSNETTVLLRNLKFPNGVSLSENGDFLLVAETTTCRITKLWLRVSKAGTLEITVAELPGLPDNIERNNKGEFWVSMNSRRGKLLKWIASNPWIGKVLVKLPFDITRLHSYMANFDQEHSLAGKLNKDGYLVEILEDKNWKYISEVDEEAGDLWIGSVVMPFVRKQKIFQANKNEDIN